MIRADSQNTIRTFNAGLLFSMVVIFLLGVTTLLSATKGPGAQGLFRSQIIYFAAGLILCAAFIFIDSQLLQKMAYPSYALCLALLGLVLVFGRVGGGSQRWLNLGFFHLQPSEIAKLAIVFTLSKYFTDEKHGAPYSLKQLLIPAMLIGPYFFLVLKQPDMGTAGIILLTAASMIFFIGVRWRSLLIVALIALVTVPIAYKFVLHDYQRNRVLTFIDPGRDPRGSGYNVLQCKIAVGSGQLFGKGYMKGTQAQLNFIPEQHTDFIFSVFAEERGFIGAIVLLFLYGMYIFFGLRTVARARDKFEMLLSFGLTAMMFWHVFINIGMVSGLLPIVGVTLPFFSYGGSSLLTFVMGTALLLNVSRKKYIF